MFEVPKLVFLILVVGAVWIFYRWLNGPARQLPRRRGSPKRAIPAEDLVSCGVCRSYVSAEAPGCGRPDCPRPR